MTTTEVAADTEHGHNLPEGIVPAQVTAEAAVDSEQSTLATDLVSERAAEGLELLWVNPKHLIIGANVRTQVAYDKEFVADIKDRGVREVIPVRRNPEGRLVVRKGQQRVLAAVEANRPEVLVLVEPELITDETRREIDRIIDQFNENEKRTQLGEADEARAVQALLDLKVSAGQIGRKLHIRPKRVKTALAVAGNQHVMDAVSEGILDLEQGAIVAEFADDAEAVEALTAAASTRPEQFDHIAQQLRDDREEARLRQEMADQLTAKGVTVIDQPTSLYGGKVRLLEQLRATPDTKSGTELTVNDHVGCPGHAAYIDYRGWRPVEDRLKAVYVCTSFQDNGHADRYASAGTVTTGPATGKMTEQQKAYRNTVIKNGKAWDSAEKVRLKWLREKFLCRKAAPKDGIRWITQTLARGSSEMHDGMKNNSLAIELLGLDKKPARGPRDSGGDPIAVAAETASPARATMLTIAQLLAALEKRTDRRNSWEKPSADVVAYFTQLDTWGYPLADVERLVLAPAGTKTTTDDDVLDGFLAEPTVEQTQVEVEVTDEGPIDDELGESTETGAEVEHTEGETGLDAELAQVDLAA